MAEEAGVLDFIRQELLGFSGEVADTSGPEDLENFLSVPSRLEAVLFLGFFMAMDAFLHVLTFQPIRMLISACRLAASVLSRTATAAAGGAAQQWNAVHAYDLQRGLCLLGGYLAVEWALDMSIVYHYIRGQAMLKLYVLTAMMEVFDKLLCSFGQDAFANMFANAKYQRGARRSFLGLLVAVIYVAVHSVLYFLHIATLTVAINSSDEALLTLLISNNFAEIKSFVFKKFDKQNLFQLVGNDIVERFKLTLFVLIIASVAISQAPSSESVWHLLGVCSMVFAGEFIADWIKHGFITKFNKLSATEYEKFVLVLAEDLISFRKKNTVLDNSTMITRKIGLAPIPLACVTLRFLRIFVTSGSAALALTPAEEALQIAWSALVVFLVLFVMKICTGVSLFYFACQVQQDVSTRRRSESEAEKLQRINSLKQLQGLERFQFWKGRIVG